MSLEWKEIAVNLPKTSILYLSVLTAERLRVLREQSGVLLQPQAGRGLLLSDLYTVPCITGPPLFPLPPPHDILWHRIRERSELCDELPQRKMAQFQDPSSEVRWLIRKSAILWAVSIARSLKKKKKKKSRTAPLTIFDYWKCRHIFWSLSANSVYKTTSLYRYLTFYIRFVWV